MKQSRSGWVCQPACSAPMREYTDGFISAFRKPATWARHVNVLEHLFGHLKRSISTREKREIALSIENYRAERVPLVVPISLLRFLVNAHDVRYVRGQLYLDPHPREMMLRNRV
jgi:uncharacterized protein YbgA (DUF1722 family)